LKFSIACSTFENSMVSIFSLMLSDLMLVPAHQL
jgi:hypothetical protein